MIKPIPVRLWEKKYRALVSVIPPNAPISPTSKVKADQRGKVPGRKRRDGTWQGYPWLTHGSSLEDVKQWAQDGANIGILGEFYPGVDIDSEDEWMSNEIARITREVLGPAPSRVGRAPKQLLMYRTGEPFSRMAITVLREDEKRHLIEVLGRGRQYLIYGEHPSGSRYTWSEELVEIDPEKDLTWIKREDVVRLFDRIEELTSVYPGVEIIRAGDGKVRERDTKSSEDLRAPSLKILRECVKLIPNDDDLFPDRDNYIKVGYAIRAAGGEGVLDVWLEWGSRWTGGTNAPETMHADWGRMHPPYSVGWGWLAELASKYGFNEARHIFEAEAPAVPVQDEEPPRYSDVWLADHIMEESGDRIRYVEALKRWYVWGDGLWKPDAVLRAENLISRSLERLAKLVERQGASDKEKVANRRVAVALCSEQKCVAVRRTLRNRPQISTRAESFDSDPWVLNTPAGIVDLRTGEMSEHDLAALCSRSTLVAPDAEMRTPRWDQFLLETTRGDIELQRYLQKLAGYSLTGSVREHVLPFIWGGGENGKGTFINALCNVMHDYSCVASMELFIASKYDRHPTELAALMGARLVSARETEAGRRWNEQKVKLLTGGDLISAHFMRQDFFTFAPQFTLIFIGNHRPGIENLDRAFRRRVHLIPFTATPKEIDLLLEEKLQAEYPGILAWMIEGTVLWLREGLNPPPVVQEATEEYFVEEDPVRRWLDECCTTIDGTEWTPTLDLFHSWSQWANERGERARSIKWLSQVLVTKGLRKHLDARTRRSGFWGITVNERLLDTMTG